MSLTRIYICLLFCLCNLLAVAQDVRFTQQYANRLYLNPAYAGLGHDWSVSLSHRNQWPALNGSFISNQFAADYRVGDTRGAVSLMFQKDRAGVGGLKKTQLTAGYAYNVQLTEKWSLSTGLQATYGMLRVDYDNLVFGDQLTDQGYTNLPSDEVNNFNPRNYYTFAVGGLFYSDNLWAGLRVGNINKPEYGFSSETKIPINYVADIGYKFYAETYHEQGQRFELSFSPTITYIHQLNFQRLDAGLYTIYTPLTLGIIYKGIPAISEVNQDQVLSVIAGLNIKSLKIGFSHDIGLSSFSKQAGGTKEITLVFEELELNKLFRGRSERKISNFVPCPAF
jgi:type IX secretion system PorP/SprF family membrane protein